MIRPEIIIAVKDVEQSSHWYQQLLGCRSSHGGSTFEILTDNDGTVVLCLHKWGEHGHPTMTNSSLTPGNGLILFFRVSDFEKAWVHAQQLKAIVEEAPHINQNSGRDEFSLRDPDGYYISVTA
ncbi:MAG TPA: VOC family protein [Chitinophaga sp.]|uniref:VOC family protein n=1 Tax=Chitinophaga sp. TaxID=1869181 RepID=UPI002C9415D1|nr:VOC family protein [Chitinophaga sp.]HVI43706.1 VOC family protein [Chitinophaga sp.]